MTVGATNQGLVAGDLVNTASRLQSVAPPGTVLVGEATRRAAEKAITFEAAGEQLLKGKAAPGRSLAGPPRRGPARRPQPQRRAGGAVRRAGRRAAPAEGPVPRHQPGGPGPAVSVIGPAGIGKTRLAWEFLKYLDGLVETVWYHDGRSPAYGEGISFWALGEMVRRRAGLLEDR